MFQGWATTWESEWTQLVHDATTKGESQTVSPLLYAPPSSLLSLLPQSLFPLLPPWTWWTQSVHDSTTKNLKYWFKVKRRKEIVFVLFLASWIVGWKTNNKYGTP